MLFYRFTYEKVAEINEIFKSTLSIDSRDYIKQSEYKHLDFKTWFNDAMQDFPNKPILFNMDRLGKSKLYKEEWKMIPKLIKRNTDVLIIGADEYVLFKDKKPVKYKQNPNNSLVRIILEIYTSMNNQYSITGQACFDYLKNTYEYTDEQAHFTIKKYLTSLKDPAFKNRIDIFYSGVDTNDNAIKDSIYKYSTSDAYLFKLLWLLFFMKNPDPVYLKHTNTITTDHENEQDNPFETAENLINAIQKLTNIKIDINDITSTTEPSYTYMDEETIDYVYANTKAE